MAAKRARDGGDDIFDECESDDDKGIEKLLAGFPRRAQDGGQKYHRVKHCSSSGKSDDSHGRESGRPGGRGHFCGGAARVAALAANGRQSHWVGWLDQKIGLFGRFGRFWTFLGNFDILECLDISETFLDDIFDITFDLGFDPRAQIRLSLEYRYCNLLIRNAGSQ